MPDEPGMPDPASSLAAWLLHDATGRTPGLRLWLLSEARNLPDDPKAARIALAGRWPALTDAERSLAFVAARNVLRGILSEMEASLARLDALSEDVGRG